MALTKDQVRQLNSFFVEDRIKDAASLVRKLTDDAPLGRLTEELGIVPNNQLEEFRENCKVVPPIISSALTRAIYAHLDAIDRDVAFDGPRAVRIIIKGGHSFGLQISQQEAYTEITLTMRTVGSAE